jgi:hypothetical protein
MIEIGKMGNSGREVMQRLVKEMQASNGAIADFASSITEIDTDFGYWWCYEAAPHHPDEAITAMIHIAKVVADAEARNSGKTYLVASIPQPMAAVYVFACNHPDARDAAINVMLEYTPAGKCIRRPAIRKAARH